MVGESREENCIWSYSGPCDGFPGCGAHDRPRQRPWRGCRFGVLGGVAVGAAIASTANPYYGGYGYPSYAPSSGYYSAPQSYYYPQSTYYAPQSYYYPQSSYYGPSHSDGY